MRMSGEPSSTYRISGLRDRGQTKQTRATNATSGSHMEAMLGLAIATNPVTPRPSYGASVPTQSGRRLAERFAGQVHRQLGTQLIGVQPADLQPRGRLAAMSARLTHHIATHVEIPAEDAALVAESALLLATAMVYRNETNDFALWDRQEDLDKMEVPLKELSGFLPLEKKTPFQIAIEESAILQNDRDVDLSDADPSDFMHGGRYSDFADSESNRIAATYGVSGGEAAQAGRLACLITARVQSQDRLDRQPYADPIAEGRLAQLDSAIGDQTDTKLEDDKKSFKAPTDTPEHVGREALAKATPADVADTFTTNGASHTSREVTDKLQVLLEKDDTIGLV